MLVNNAEVMWVGTFETEPGIANHGLPLTLRQPLTTNRPLVGVRGLEATVARDTDVPARRPGLRHDHHTHTSVVR